MPDINGYLYDGMYFVGFALMMIVNLKTYKRYGLTKTSTVLITLITYVAGVSSAMIMGSLYSAVAAKYDSEGSTVAIFGAVFFTPIFMSVVALIAGKSWRKVMDMLAPGIFIILTCAKFGCFFGQCCPGRVCNFGFYNSKYEMTMFPSQLFESATMCFVVAFCFWFALKSKKCISGSVYPVTAAVYSVTRFGWEFMRYYSSEELRHLVFGLTFWQLWCVIIIIVSTVWVILLKNEKLVLLEEKYYAFAISKWEPFVSKIEKIKHRNDKNIVHHDKNKKKYQKK